jgi:hypothetical protein
MFLYFRMAQEEEDDNQEDPCPDSSLSMTTITPAATVYYKKEEEPMSNLRYVSSSKASSFSVNASSPTSFHCGRKSMNDSKP